MDKTRAFRVSKLDAARRQLDCAIEMWFADKDEVSIHVLATAAHQLIHDLKQKKGGGELLFDATIIKDEYRSEYISFLKKQMNFFKHADSNAEEIIAFPPTLSILFMLFSIKGLEQLGERRNDIEHIFFLWVAIHKPTWASPDFVELMAERVPVEHMDIARSLKKQEFLESMTRALAESKYRGSV